MLNKRVATLLIGTILMGSLAVGCGSSDSSNSIILYNYFL